MDDSIKLLSFDKMYIGKSTFSSFIMYFEQFEVTLICLILGFVFPKIGFYCSNGNFVEIKR